jgi:glycosyltransferase involved in cell wall biosynthesis
VSSVIARKLRSARYRLDEAVRRFRENAAARERDKLFNEWLHHLRTDPPQVLVGSNFADFGGVRQHLHAIANYSSLDVELAPPDTLLDRLGAHEIKSRFRDKFKEFSPGHLKAIHSHVFPWFIEWCDKHRGSGAVWVHTYHLPYFPEHAKGALEPWQEEINETLTGPASRADVKLSVSRWQQQWLLEQHGIETHYLPNGVDVIACDRADGQRFKTLIGMRDFILYVGRNDPVKNPSEFARLAERVPEREFVMIGRGLNAAAFRSEWDFKNVPKNLHILGELPNSAVHDAIAACSALVVTSKREGLPTLVLEAMALRANIVVPDEAGCLEAISNGQYGSIYPLGDVDALAESVLASASIAKSNAAARERVLTEYDWRVVAPKLDTFYMGTIRGR